MKLTLSNLKTIYGRLSTLDINSVFDKAKNLKASDLKESFSDINRKYFNADFIFFSKYSPFLAISVFSILIIPSSIFALNKLAKLQKLNQQYTSEKLQIDALNNDIQSLISKNKLLSARKSSIDSLLLSPDQVDQLPFAIDDLSKMHSIKIDEFQLLTADNFSSELSGGGDIFSMDSGTGPVLEEDPALDPGADPGADPGVDPGVDPDADPPPPLDPSTDSASNVDSGSDLILDENTIMDEDMIFDEEFEDLSNNSASEIRENFEGLLRVKVTATGNYNRLSFFLDDLTKLGFYSFMNSIHFESPQGGAQSEDSGATGSAKLTLLMTIPLLEQ